MSSDLKIGGYIFGTSADADLAYDEQETVNYLDSNMNYSSTAKVQQLYDRALDTRMFRTPVGWDYLNKLRNVLLDAGVSEKDIRPIPLYAVFARPEEDVGLARKVRPTPQKKNPYRAKFYISAAISVILIFTVAVMFVMTMQSDTPNMLNYRSAIENEYASWEQDIKERETAVRAKERELGMPSELPHEEQEAMKNGEEEDNG